MSPPNLRQLAPAVHVSEAPQRFFGIQVGARMTLIELDGGILAISPLAGSLPLAETLGRPRWALAPNKLHHLYVGAWAEAGIETWAAPGLAEKRDDVRFHGTIGDGTAPFGGDIVVKPLACFGYTNEVVVLHRPSRTLVVCDLVFNFSSQAPLLTRLAMRCLCGYPGCRTSLLERFGMRRAVARQELTEILSWDFERLVMAHGEVIDKGGKDALRSAFRWLKL